MNKIDTYWQQYCEMEGLSNIRYTEAFQFGEKADWLASLVVAGTKTVSKFLMVSALAAIGLNTSFSSFRKSGIRPMLHGFIISAAVVVVAIAVEWCMGLV